MARITQLLSIVLAALVFLAAMPSSACAQGQSISVTDTKNTARTIRKINKIADSAVIGLARLQTNVDSLLIRIEGSGASDTRLMEVTEFYQRSATAARYRREAQINSDAGKQALKLRAKSSSEGLLADLEEARQTSIAQVIAAEGEALDAIEASLVALIGT